MLIGRPFVREYAADSVDAATARSDGFRTITPAMTWMWVAVFAGMTVPSAVPPVVDGAATLRDEAGLLSVLCYWVLPFVLLGIGGLLSGLVPPWFERRSALVGQREADEAPVVAAQPPPPPSVSDGRLALTAPADSRHDEPFGVTVRGAPAHTTVELAATGIDLYRRTWRSLARLAAPATGRSTSARWTRCPGTGPGPISVAPDWAMRRAASVHRPWVGAHRRPGCAPRAAGGREPGGLTHAADTLIVRPRPEAHPAGYRPDDQPVGRHADRPAASGSASSRIPPRRSTGRTPR